MVPFNICFENIYLYGFPTKRGHAVLSTIFTIFAFITFIYNLYDINLLSAQDFSRVTQES